MCNLQQTRIQAAVQTEVDTFVKQRLTLGMVYVISNFNVQHYGADETYKCINFDKKLVISKDT